MQTATPARDEACAFDGKVETWVEDECTACVFKDLLGVARTGLSCPT
jgi:hypothetical protein